MRTLVGTRSHDKDAGIKMKELCFLTVGHAGYSPLWLYSISKAYPRATALVFLKREGIDTPALAQAICKVQSSKLKIILGEFDDYKVTPKYGPMLRFLLYTPRRIERYLKGFKYFYIGDVDHIICPESFSLVEQHLKFCEREGLPYSAMMRVREPKLIAGRVFATRQFVTKVAKVTKKYDEWVRAKGQFIFKPVPFNPDEHLSYKIIVESGLTPPPQLKPYTTAREFQAINPISCEGSGPFAPMHGLHLGFARRPVASMKEKYAGLIDCRYYRNYFLWALILGGDPLFRTLVSLMPEASADTVHRTLALAKEYSI